MKVGIILGILLLIIGFVLLVVACFKDDCNHEVLIFFGALLVGMSFVCLHEIIEKIYNVIYLFDVIKDFLEWEV